MLIKRKSLVDRPLLVSIDLKYNQFSGEEFDERENPENSVSLSQTGAFYKLYCHSIVGCEESVPVVGAAGLPGGGFVSANFIIIC